jgi:hypothetical protein
MADRKLGTQGTAQAAANGPAAGAKAGRKRKKLTKVEAVRRAMAALGEEASRTDLQGYVRQKFGFNMNLNHISTCKTKLAKLAAKAETPNGSKTAAARPAAAPAASRKPSPLESRAARSAPGPRTRPAGANASSNASVRLEDVLTTKVLIDRMGAGPLKTLIDGLAK